MRLAQVYFSVMEGRERRLGVVEGFKSAAGYLKRELSRRLGLRYMPELKFVYDESFDRAANLDRILKTVNDGTQSTTSKPSET
jgi:ribosome-binding factor A